MIPNPLHPAIVHFPIVLLIVAAPIAVVSIFLPKWHLPILAALLLSGGFVGSVAATWTGDQEEEMAGEISATAERVLDSHEEWGERTQVLAGSSALLAILTVALLRFPRISRGLAVLAALGSAATALAVAQTGHFGGQLVYKHGLGINVAAGQISQSAPTGVSETQKHKHEEDED